MKAVLIEITKKEIEHDRPVYHAVSHRFLSDGLYSWKDYPSDPAIVQDTTYLLKQVQQPDGIRHNYFVKSSDLGLFEELMLINREEFRKEVIRAKAEKFAHNDIKKLLEDNFEQGIRLGKADSWKLLKALPWYKRLFLR